jgi:hypothetical protein
MVEHNTNSRQVSRHSIISQSLQLDALQYYVDGGLTPELVAAMGDVLTGDWRAYFGQFIAHLRTLDRDDITGFLRDKRPHLAYAIGLGGDVFLEEDPSDDGQLPEGPDAEPEYSADEGWRRRSLQFSTPWRKARAP